MRKQSLRVLVRALSFLISVAGTTRAEATTLTFESTPTGASVPDGYGGLNWSTELSTFFDGGGFGVHSVSPSNYLFAGCCGSVDEISVSSGTFDLLSGFFSNLQNTNTSYTIHGFLGINEIFTQAVAPNGTPTFFVLNMTGVDRVSFGSSFADNLGMDDLNVNVPSAAAVPEPATMILLSAGLAVVAVRRLRRSRL